MDGLSVTLAYSRRRRNERSQEYLSSMLTTWPCRLHCASLDFHPPGDPSTWLHQTASKRREAGANPHKAVYRRCSAELNRTASFIKSDVFVKRWPDLGFRFELGLIGVSCLVHRANWGGISDLSICNGGLHTHAIQLYIEKKCFRSRLSLKTIQWLHGVGEERCQLIKAN